STNSNCALVTKHSFLSLLSALPIFAHPLDLSADRAAARFGQPRLVRYVLRDVPRLRGPIEGSLGILHPARRAAICCHEGSTDEGLVLIRLSPARRSSPEELKVAASLLEGELRVLALAAEVERSVTVPL